jgi:2,3-bisphosphoglycerate-independent phosphoglycerate mutase
MKDMTIEKTNAELAKAVAGFKSPGLFFCHWAEPDVTGHKSGMDSEPWCERIIELDKTLGKLTEAIKPDFVLIYSDHGFDGPKSRQHNHAPHGFVACSRTLACGGVRRDVAYTVLTVLGVPLDGPDHTLCGKSLIA